MSSEIERNSPKNEIFEVENIAQNAGNAICGNLYFKIFRGAGGMPPDPPSKPRASRLTF